MVKRVIFIFLITLPSCEFLGGDEDVVFSYNAFPDILMTKSGKLICVYYQGWNHESVADPDSESKRRGGRIMVSESLDLGRNWSESSLLIDTNLDDRDPSIVQLDDGRILCNFFQYHRKGKKIYLSTYSIESADDGHSWGRPKKLLENHAISSPFRKLSNGSLAMTTYKMDGSCYVSFSKDNAASWTTPTRFFDKGSKHEFSEPDMIEVDGKLIVVLRSDSKNMHQVSSSDFGKTWSPLEDIGFVGAAPYLVHFDDNMVVLGHRIPATSLRYSKSDMINWSESVFIDYGIEANGAYPSFATLEPRRLIVCYYYEYSKDIDATIRFKEITFSNGHFIVSDVISEIGK